ncbi:MAG: hypothetical protein ACI4VQ_07225 [Clostridia bacterium]
MQTTSEAFENGEVRGIQHNRDETIEEKVTKLVEEFIEIRSPLHRNSWRYTYGELAVMFIDPAIASRIFWEHGWGFEVIPIDETETVKYEIRVP